MAFDFTGKRILVAGGSRGIGRSIALAFAAAGADVSICARGAQVLEATRDELARHGRRVHAAACDLADGGLIGAYVAEAFAALGGLDVLVNNASGFGMGDGEDGWAAGLAVDVMAMVRTSHAALPALLAAPGSSIVNIVSISGFRPSTRAPAYAAAKAAMLARQGGDRSFNRPQHSPGEACGLGCGGMKCQGLGAGALALGSFGRPMTVHKGWFRVDLRVDLGSCGVEPPCRAAPPRPRLGGAARVDVLATRATQAEKSCPASRPTLGRRSIGNTVLGSTARRRIRPSRTGRC